MAMAVSEASRALDQLLKESASDTEDVRRARASIRAQIHRTQLHRYRTGRGKPDAITIERLHYLSGGRISASGWADLAESESDGGEAA